MDYLYPVHDGSTGKIGLGWEDFGVEAIHWENGRKTHTPLYSKLSNASCPDYVSQNHQIMKAIRSVYEQLDEWCGVWAFDRLHDRTILFKFLLKWMKRKGLFLPICRWRGQNKSGGFGWSFAIEQASVVALVS